MSSKCCSVFNKSSTPVCTSCTSSSKFMPSKAFGVSFTSLFNLPTLSKALFVFFSKSCIAIAIPPKAPTAKVIGLSIAPNDATKPVPPLTNPIALVRPLTKLITLGTIVNSGPRAATSRPTFTIVSCLPSLRFLKSVAKSFIKLAASVTKGINTSPKAIPAPSNALCMAFRPPFAVSSITSAIPLAAPSEFSKAPVSSLTWPTPSVNTSKEVPALRPTSSIAP